MNKLKKNSKNKENIINYKIFRGDCQSHTGITLISLIVTIIVLLILAGIAINLSIGDNGLFNRAKSAVEKYKIAANEESEFFEELDKSFAVGNSKLPIRTQVIGYDQYIDNCSNGISAIQMFNGALGENKSIIERIIYLIISEDYDKNDEIVIQELQDLENEFNRIYEESCFKFHQPIKIYYNTTKYIEISSNLDHINIDFSTSETIKNSVTKLQGEMQKIDNEINELNKKEETVRKIISELEIKNEELLKYDYLDNIELKEVELNGELESEKIESINQMLKNINDIIKLQSSSEEKLSEIYSKLCRINELIYNGSNDEIIEIKQEIDLIANEMRTINETFIIDIQGEKITIKIRDLNTNYLGKDNTPLYLDVSNKERSQESLDNAIYIIDCERANLGAILNRVDHTIKYYTRIKDVLESRIKNKEDRNKRLAIVSLEEMQYCLDRIRTLMIRSHNGVNSIKDKYGIKLEIDQILLEINRIATHTMIENDTGLLNGQWNKNINVTLESLAIKEINNDTEENIQAGIRKLEESIIKIYENRKALAK